VSVLLLDTHIWAWSLYNDPKLTDGLRDHIGNARLVYVSPISLFEIGQKMRIGKWPEMEPYVPGLAEVLKDQGADIAALTPAICLQAAAMPWRNRDPFDRLLAATAQALGANIVSLDAAFDEVSELPARIGA
jgi:PIN domain nuclease of toxin-antitoxin system